MHVSLSETQVSLAHGPRRARLEALPLARPLAVEGREETPEGVHGAVFESSPAGVSVTVSAKRTLRGRGALAGAGHHMSSSSSSDSSKAGREAPQATGGASSAAGVFGPDRGAAGVCGPSGDTAFDLW